MPVSLKHVSCRTGSMRGLGLLLTKDEPGGRRTFSDESLALCGSVMSSREAVLVGRYPAPPSVWGRKGGQLPFSRSLIHGGTDARMM